MVKRKRTTTVRAPVRRPYSRNFVDIYITGQNTVEGQVLQRIGHTEVLCVNSASTSNPTPGILKTTRFRFQGSLTFVTATAPTRQFVKVGMLYIPEVERNMIANYDSEQMGSYLQQSLINEPERLLAYKNVPLTANTNGTCSISMSSRMSRNLKSGDGIFFVVLAGYNGDSALQNVFIIRGEVIFYNRYN